MKPYFVPVTLLTLALAHSAASRPQPMGACCSVDRGITLNEAEYQPGDDPNSIPLSSGMQVETPIQVKRPQDTPGYQLAKLPYEIHQQIYNIDSLLRLSETDRHLYFSGKDGTVRTNIFKRSGSKYSKEIMRAESRFERVQRALEETKITLAESIGICTILATIDQFPILRELERLLEEHRPFTYLALKPYVTLLHWDFDKYFTDPEDQRNYTFGYDCRYAGTLGFTTAEKKCNAQDPSEVWDFGLLVDWTAGGFVHFRRDSLGKPKLAIRVHRETVNELIKANKLEKLNEGWLPHSELEYQLELVRNQPKYKKNGASPHDI
ncbi:LOW QUALITY PROTEIN: hypothetical protein BJ085DRAFT_33651 [Dimargaris cristalligena]|uniref:Uncharacterized protein n=1 Tax=Dimargaris cristalligena TaxID=215637 RepID=A0A4P9ZWZ0_9FUNG|nr:LOW QUALITY PROTEIN: hypothetical protein BJ085DRAFT_33651 [Dimargaris cristalligena]|eukprot:RKP37382.1 LOW QUALITY PROTEIN: hypothetical protein BJ085DRAFT_33651 [Dimargaris cristalligena]